MVIYLIAFIVLQIAGITILGNLLAGSTDTRFEGYLERQEGLNNTGFYIQIVIFAVSYFFLRNNLEDKLSRILIHLCLIGLIFQSLSTSIAEMFRISMYFSTFNILLLANAVAAKPNGSVYSLVKIGIMLVLGYHFFFSGNAVVAQDYNLAFLN